MLFTCPDASVTSHWRPPEPFIYITEYYSVEKNNDILKFEGKWINLENNILNEVSQTHEDKYS